MRPDLSVLDLSPIAAGSTAGAALRATLDLARAAEEMGYARFWLAEHHLNPGLAGSAPHVLAAHVADATQRIRVGTAVTILGNYAPLQVAEAVATTAALHPGRIDVGLGRSGSPGSPPGSTAAPAPPAAAPGAAPDLGATRVVDGVVLPPPVRPDLSHPRWAAQDRMLRRSAGDGDRFGDDVRSVLALLAGPVPADPGAGPGSPSVTAAPAGRDGDDGAQVWVHGSSAGTSAQLAGALGLRFGANYHVAPARVLEAVTAYRAAFRPSADLDRPHVIVSADVVVADTEAAARDLAAAHAAWVWSIRRGAGAIPYPAPGREPALDADGRAAVADRVATQLVGAPRTVVERLDALARLTGADELLLTTATFDPAARRRSFDLLAQAWSPPSRSSALSAAS